MQSLRALGCRGLRQGSQMRAPCGYQSPCVVRYASEPAGRRVWAASRAMHDLHACLLGGRHPRSAPLPCSLPIRLQATNQRRSAAMQTTRLVCRAAPGPGGEGQQGSAHGASAPTSRLERALHASRTCALLCQQSGPAAPPTLPLCHHTCSAHAAADDSKAAAAAAARQQRQQQQQGEEESGQNPYWEVFGWKVSKDDVITITLAVAISYGIRW